MIKKVVQTIIRLTTVTPPVFLSSCLRPSEDPSIVNFDAQYETIPVNPKLAATELVIRVILFLKSINVKKS